jgi:hypothetical protein
VSSTASGFEPQAVSGIYDQGVAETEPQSVLPTGGGKPPAPPGIGDPGRGRPDPFDRGAPIAVSVNGRPIGDLGNRAVDARLLSAVLEGWSEVAEWLVALGVVAEADPEPDLTHGHVKAAFPGATSL